MFDEGHGVALHSNTRALMLQSPEDLAETLDRQADHIEQLSGRRPCPLFRPHAGWRSGNMYAGIARAGYRLVGWSWGLWDWDWFRKRNGRRIAKKLAQEADPGEIVVLHDGHHVDPRADRQYAVDATALLVPELKKRGFRLGTLCQP
jgi:peptidoglycan-N-acetylglucosamine deacetylase